MGPASHQNEAAPRVFVIDDRFAARTLLRGLALSLAPNVVVEDFSGPHAALERLHKIVPDLIRCAANPVLQGGEG